MDTRNRSHAKMLGISIRKLRLESFHHPQARYDNAKITQAGEAYWARRHAEHLWNQKMSGKWTNLTTNANEQE